MKLEDIPIASQVFIDSFNSVNEEWKNPYAEDRLKQHYHEESCWIAEIDGNIVGVLTGEEDNVADHKELYIDILAVSPSMHKQGIGEKLLSTAEYHARSKGYGGLWLNASEELASYKWYLRTGFFETNWRALVKPFEEEVYPMDTIQPETPIVR